MQRNQTDPVINWKAFPECVNDFDKVCEEIQREKEAEGYTSEEDDEDVVMRKINNVFEELKSRNARSPQPIPESQDIFTIDENSITRNKLTLPNDLEEQVKALQDYIKENRKNLCVRAGSDEEKSNSTNSAEELNEKLTKIERVSSELVRLMQSEEQCREVVLRCQDKARLMDFKLLNDFFDLIMALELK